MSDENLWGSIPEMEAYRSPATILREQASKLAEMTGNVLQARVRQAVLPRRRATFDQEPPADLVYSFDIVAPALDGYAYRVFLIWHGALGYPVAIQADPDFLALPCSDEEEFRAMLRSILGAERTQHVIASLLAQSTAVSEGP